MVASWKRGDVVSEKKRKVFVGEFKALDWLKKKSGTSP